MAMAIAMRKADCIRVHKLWKAAMAMAPNGSQGMLLKNC